MQPLLSGLWLPGWRLLCVALILTIMQIHRDILRRCTCENIALKTASAASGALLRCGGSTLVSTITRSATARPGTCARDRAKSGSPCTCLALESYLF